MNPGTTLVFCVISLPIPLLSAPNTVVWPGKRLGCPLKPPDHLHLYTVPPFLGLLCPSSWGITTSCSPSPACLPPAGLFRSDLGGNQDPCRCGGWRGCWHRCLGGECLSIIVLLLLVPVGEWRHRDQPGWQGAGAAPWPTMCPRVATEPSSIGTPNSSSLSVLGMDATGCDPSPCWVEG